MENVIVALVSVAVGALLGGAVNAATSRYAAFKEAQGIAAGLRMEVVSVTELVRARNYLGQIDQIIARLERLEYTPAASDFFSPAVTQEYFRVFTSNCSKIGLLGEAGPTTVRAYMLAQAVIEDLRRFGEDRRLLEEGRRTANREGLLRATQELRTVLRLAIASGDEAIPALRNVELQGWLWRRR